MKIKGFIWLDDIVQKLLWKHAVTQKEVAENFANRPRFRFVEKVIARVRMSTPLLGRQTAGVIW